jgi:hypothetical protein
VTPEDARSTLSLVAAIYASAFLRRPVTPGDLAPGAPFYAHMNGGTHGW